MQLRKSSRDLLYFIFSLALLVMAIIFGSGRMLVISSIISSLNIIRKVKKSQILLLLSIFFFLYVMPSLFYYFFNTEISAYEEFKNPHTYYMTTLIHCVFLFVFSNTVHDSKIRPDDDNLQIDRFKSDIPFFICVLGIIATTVLGKSGETIFSGGGYGEGGGSGSALFEYCYIFYLMAYVFSGNSKAKHWLLILLAVVYVGKSFLYGARIEILAMAILVFVCFFSHTFKTRTILLLAAIAYFGMSLFGIFRGNLNVSSFNIGSLIGYNSTTNTLINNEADVFYTSAAVFGVTEYDFCTFQYRAGAMLNYLVRLVIPSSLVPTQYDVIGYLGANSGIGGGGLFSAFLYFYGTWIGVVLGGWFCGRLWNYLGRINRQAPARQIFVIMALVMAPRWYAYAPEAIVKIPLYTVIIYEVFRFIFCHDQRPVNPEKQIWISLRG